MLEDECYEKKEQVGVGEENGGGMAILYMYFVFAFKKIRFIEV